MPRRLTIATHNAHKVAEIRAIIGEVWEVTDLAGHPDLAPPEETGATFAENATIKALAVSAHVPGLVLADDSGLEVDALGGLPGVQSARFAGPGAGDVDNRRRLLRELAAIAPPRPWTARFHCTIAVARSGEVLHMSAGTVEGQIIPEERGQSGFGYDSLFIPKGYAETFAELPCQLKNRLSHRARALFQVTPYLSSIA